MEGQTVLVDTSILVDYFRKKRKDKASLYTLSLESNLAVSTITEFEFLVGLKEEHIGFAIELFKRFAVFPFDSRCATVAALIYRGLKEKNKLISVADIFIAATAVSNKAALATLNRRHFERIEGLEIVRL